jgi:hypothetical protein
MLKLFKVYIKVIQNFFLSSLAVLFFGFLIWLSLNPISANLIDVLNNRPNVFFSLRVLLVLPIWNWEKDMIRT